MSQNSSPENVPSANQGMADSVAAPGCVGAGGTNCPHCGIALVPSADVFDRIAGFAHEECACRVSARAELNKPHWLSVANFLATQNLHQVLQARAQAAAARGPACGDASAAGEAAINFGGYADAYPTPIPVGNTGTTSTGQGV